jgi:glycosyltransferase involved in cell wall biosynthesis
MRILFSIAYNPTFEPPAGVVDGHTVVVDRRACDWGLRGVRKHVHQVWEAVRVLRAARSFDALALCTVGVEAFIIAKFKRWFGAKHLRLVVFDVLIPKDSRQARLVGPWLSGADLIAVIRRGDVATLHRRFGVPPEKCAFVPFPAPALAAGAPCPEADYIYSAGFAHRDWPTLIQALSLLPYRAIICPGCPVEIPADAQQRIEVRAMPPPELGRRWMASARLVVQSFLDTELPSGPLILLDAMAMGKPVVATKVNGTRDYSGAGVDCLLVAPGDVGELTQRIREAMEDEDLRRRLVAGARAKAASLSLQRTVRALLSLCEG